MCPNPRLFIWFRLARSRACLSPRSGSDSGLFAGPGVAPHLAILSIEPLDHTTYHPSTPSVRHACLITLHSTTSLTVPSPPMFRHTVSIVALACLSVVFGQQCSQYGNVSGNGCICPPGFNTPGSDNTCALPVCGGSLYDPASAAPGGDGGFGNLSLGDGGCGCSNGWSGPACTGALLLARGPVSLRVQRQV